MRSKLMFVIGLAAGYVLGTRAGRERYEQLKAGAERLWTNPSVQAQVHRAEDYLRERAPEVVQKVESTARKVGEQVKTRRSGSNAPSSEA